MGCGRHPSAVPQLAYLFIYLPSQPIPSLSKLFFLPLLLLSNASELMLARYLFYSSCFPHISNHPAYLHISTIFFTLKRPVLARLFPLWGNQARLCIDQPT